MFQTVRAVALRSSVKDFEIGPFGVRYGTATK